MDSGQITSTDLASILNRLKSERGILVSDTSADAFYNEKITFAISSLLSEDIVDCSLRTDFGKTVIIYYASLLIDGKDIASDATLTLMRNTLSAMAKGERYSDD